jgi:hypothetical protein
VLFPNERIGSDGIKIMKILRSKRPELEQFAFQKGLKIEGHSDFSLIVCRLRIQASGT